MLDKKKLSILTEKTLGNTPFQQRLTFIYKNFYIYNTILVNKAY